jgi:Tfp pilus assembly protein PilZ
VEKDVEAASCNRENPRYEVNAYVAYGGTEALLYRIQNISLGGICIQSAIIEEVGSRVDLVINFPELAAHVEVQGEVVWVNRTDPKDMGIRYIGMDEARRDTLRRYIEKVQSGQPA